MPVDDRSEMAKDVEKVGGEMDYDISSDGNGSLRIDARERVLVDLYRVWGNEEDLSFRQLVYEAKVRTEQASAPVFLVMQAGLTSAPHGMPVVGRDKAIHGTNDWTTLQIWAGNPPGTRLLETTLQLEIDGPGTVWIVSTKTPAGIPDQGLVCVWPRRLHRYTGTPTQSGRTPRSAISRAYTTLAWSM
jgi:hypothetical protein